MDSPNKNRKSFKEKYDTIERIGAGKMGVIYKVKKKVKDHPQEEEFYVSKHISLHRIDLEVARKELKILEQLKHVYIVRYYEDFIENDELILIMDYCGEKDLAHHIERMKSNSKYFNQNLVSTWIFQLILVMEYIHSMSIVHRDLKPQNVFIDKEMNIKIGDFGVSKLLEGTENCKTMAGTPFYFSPELSRSEPYTNKTDIWSLGCVIFEICTLQKPFTGKQGLMDLICAIQTKQPKNIPSLYSPDLNKLIKKMLIKEPKKRPTARQLLQDPILVQLMVNYSSQINLKSEYEEKAVEKPTLTDSFIENQAGVVQQRMKLFEQEVRNKMEGLKNKKVKTSQIDKYYAEVQKKMKDLEKVMQIAFVELKMRSEPEDNQSNSQMSQTIRSSSISASGETLQSINLGTVSKVNKSKLINKSVPEEEDSMESVQSILIQSKAKPNLGSTIKNSSLKSSSKIGNSLKRSKMENSQQLDATVQSEFMATIQKSQNIGEVRDNTMMHLEQVEKQIINNPDVMLDETFLSLSLSISNNDQLISRKTLGKSKKGINIGHSGSYEDSINFDFSKKEYDLKNIPGITEENSEEQIEDQSEIKVEEGDSLQQYEADFQAYEEDTEMDIRKQERQSVKELFTSTVKSFNIKNDSGSSNLSSVNSSEFNRKYNPSLSVIKEQSNEGGSLVSRNGDLE